MLSFITSMRRDAQLPRKLLLLLIPFGLFALASYYGQMHFYRDPTSPYFDASRAYGRYYSKTRQEEALAFVSKYNETGAEPFRNSRDTTFAPFICVGMNTIVRPSGDVYARVTLGSLLAGLTQKERNQLYIMPMIGHINASVHPIYNEPWLERVTDRVLTYQTASVINSEQLAHIAHLESEREKTGQPDREKHLGDYKFLLRECAATKAPYVLMIEDDVLFLDGWFHRTRNAIKDVETRTDRDEAHWFYIRLFHVGGSVTFSPEEIRYYAALITAGFAGFGFLVYWVMGRGGAMASVRAKYGRWLLLGLVISYALSVAFFFTAGRLSVAPLSIGVRPNQPGSCCAQGLVYRHDKIAPLTAWYESQRYGFVDSLAERLADEKPDGIDMGSRWTMTPAVLQHVGGKSSKVDNWGSDKPGFMSEAQRLWNFYFENNNKDKLAAEHKEAAERLEEERIMGDD